MIASPLEAHLVDRIAAALPGVDVLFDPELLPAPRYPSDHRGVDGFRRDDVAEARWNAMLGRAEVLFGIPGDSAAGLQEAVPRAPALRWVHGTSAGAGELVSAAQLAPADFARITFTTSAGVHGGMLAEFTFYGLLALRKDTQRLERIRAARGWDHFAMEELDGSTIAIVGMGGIGTAVAQRARAFGMHVIGVARTVQPNPAADENVAIDAATEAYRRADAIVVTLPGTEATRHLIDRATIEAFKPSAIFINVGRGTVVDQAALVDALATGAIRGAVLDVCSPEPLPPDNPLWTLPNVIFSPHTAALSVRENQRIVELFCANLRRYAAGERLRNVVNVREFY
jgi:phosphoglycerate dehydrogenase-like enzyme